MIGCALSTFVIPDDGVSLVQMWSVGVSKFITGADIASTETSFIGLSTFSYLLMRCSSFSSRF